MSSVERERTGAESGVGRRVVRRGGSAVVASGLGMLCISAFAFALGFARSAPVAVAASSRPAPTATTTTPARRDDSGCTTCHGSRAIADRQPRAEGARLFVTPDALAGSAHAGLACTACHPKPSAVLHADPVGELATARASCDGCHAEEARGYVAGAHGPSTRLPTVAVGRSAPEAREGKPAARPTCVSCHGAHDAARVRSANFAVTAARACSGCHGERGASFFERNYHGKQLRLARVGIAVCADCHTAHLVLPASDSRSPVSRANVVATCRRCHPAATTNFGDIRIHLAGAPFPDDVLLRLVTAAMVLLVVSVFGLFGAHTVLRIRHAWRAPGGAPADGNGRP